HPHRYPAGQTTMAPRKRLTANTVAEEPARRASRRMIQYRPASTALWSVLRDARLRLAPQDEAVVCAGTNDPSGATAHRACSQASATSITRSGGSAIMGIAQRRTAARSLSRVRYS